MDFFKKPYVPDYMTNIRTDCDKTFSTLLHDGFAVHHKNTNTDSGLIPTKPFFELFYFFAADNNILVKRYIKAYF